jgi:hypothetical protein
LSGPPDNRDWLSLPREEQRRLVADDLMRFVYLSPIQFDAGRAALRGIVGGTVDQAVARIHAAVEAAAAPETVASRQAAEIAARPRPVPVVSSAPLADALPNVARRAIGLEVRNPPVHRAQIKPIPGEIDTEGWLARVRILPVWQNLSAKCRMSIARAIVWGLGKAARPEDAVRGVSQLSYTSIATAAQCSRVQVWRAIRQFEAFGILDTFNVIVRVGNDKLRDPNAYVLRGFTKAIPVVVEAVRDKITGAFDRMNEQLRRFVDVWDMKANHWGLRATPTSRTYPRPT